MSAQFKPFSAVFDDGTRIDMQSSTRDLLKLEQTGVVFRDLPPFEATYRLAYVTLQRYARLERLPDGFEVPESAEALMDLADIDAQADDDEGEASGQEANTG